MLANEYSICYKGTNYQLYGCNEDPFFKIADIAPIFGDLTTEPLRGILMLVGDPADRKLTRMIPVGECCVLFNVHGVDFINAVDDTFKEMLGGALHPDTLAECRSNDIDAYKSQDEITLHSSIPYDEIADTINGIETADEKYKYARMGLRKLQYGIGSFYERLQGLGATNIEPSILNKCQAKLDKLTVLVQLLMRDALHSEPCVMTNYKPHPLERILKNKGIETAPVKKWKRPLIRSKFREMEQTSTFKEIIQQQINYKFYNSTLTKPEYDEQVIQWTQGWVYNHGSSNTVTKKQCYERYCNMFEKYAVCEVTFDSIMFDAGYGIAQRDSAMFWIRLE